MRSHCPPDVSVGRRAALATVLLVGTTFVGTTFSAARIESADFLRGDTDGNGVVDISDPVRLLGMLFVGEGSPECDDAADANDDGRLDVSDPLTILFFLFADTVTMLPAPGTETCGSDPTEDALGCDSNLFCSRDPTPPRIMLTSPTNLLVVGEASLEVSGSVSDDSDPVADLDVTVNGVPAAVDAQTGEFQATITLREGINAVTAVAIDRSSNSGSATVSVVLDTQAPILTVETPPLRRDKAEGEADIEIDAARVTITGYLNDVGSAQVGGLPGRVVVRSLTTGGQLLIDDLEAQLQDKAFVVFDFPLRRGFNAIEVRGVDGVGNASAPVKRLVLFRDIAGQRINRVSGDGQTNVILTPLPLPLVVSLTDRDGRAVANRNVHFEVVRNSGLLSTMLDGEATSQSLFVRTSAAGTASVFLTLGDRVGAGFNRVRATAAGFQGEVVFCATAIAGTPDKILATEGSMQTGSPGQPLPRPLVALCVDKEGNPIPQLPVTFEVLQGGGGLTRGGVSGDGGGMAESSLVVETNAAGLASATFHLGEQEGINSHVATARFAGLEGFEATFIASAKAPLPVELTSFVGVVLDNSDLPLDRVTVTLIAANEAGATLTDSEGRFRIEGAPVGTVSLNVDGSTTTRPGIWPTLAFQLTTIAGQENSLGEPIRLPELDSESARLVGGDEAVVVPMRDVPGMSLTVFPNSVTFPDGSKTGFVSLTQVKLDKVPMPPPNGSIFMPPAWTVQPPGVHFDPPAQVSIPNDGMIPGRIIDIFQFDHDLEQFVNVGTGTTVEDGSVIISDPGAGITKSGWGGCGQPPLPQTCITDCDDGNPCTDDSCQNGQCVHTPRADGQPCDQGRTTAGNESCGVCQNGQCSPSAADGTPCDDMNRCTEDDECQGGECKGRPDPPETLGAIQVNIDLSGPAVEQVILVLRSLQVLKDVQAKLQIAGKQERECCQDESKPKRAINRSISITVFVRVAGAKIKLPLPPPFTGIFVVGSIGVDVNSTAQLKFDNCAICAGVCGTWTGGGGGSVGINGALGIQFGPDFLNVTGAAKTGITGSATITGKCRCVELALGLKFNGVSVGVTATAFTLEVTLFEGFIVDPRDIGTVKQKLPVP